MGVHHLTIDETGEGPHWAETRARQGEAARQRALDWLESQARISAFWRDRLIDAAADQALVDAVDRQSDWLCETLDQLRRG